MAEEFSTRDAALALGFVFLVLFTLALSMTGYISSPLMLGMLVTLTAALIFLGQWLVKAKAIAKSALPLWYVFVLGLVLLLYGAIQAGYIPVAFMMPGASVAEIALTSAMLYALVIVAVAAAFAAGFAASRHVKK